MYPTGGEERFQEAHPVARRLMNDLAGMPIRPYGSRGRVWPKEGAEPTHRSRHWHSLKDVLDPQGLLHPGAIV